MFDITSLCCELAFLVQVSITGVLYFETIYFSTILQLVLLFKSTSLSAESLQYFCRSLLFVLLCSICAILSRLCLHSSLKRDLLKTGLLYVRSCEESE